MTVTNDSVTQERYQKLTKEWVIYEVLDVSSESKDAFQVKSSSQFGINENFLSKDTKEKSFIGSLLVC